MLVHETLLSYAHHGDDAIFESPDLQPELRHTYVDRQLNRESPSMDSMI